MCSSHVQRGKPHLTYSIVYTIKVSVVFVKDVMIIKLVLAALYLNLAALLHGET
jgi:hypothetical protein